MLVIVALFTTLILRIFDLQIVNENYYMSTYIQKAEKTVYSPGTRGNIYDCKGNLLAYDSLAYVAALACISAVTGFTVAQGTFQCA